MKKLNFSEIRNNNKIELTVKRFTVSGDLEVSVIINETKTFGRLDTKKKAIIFFVPKQVLGFDKKLAGISLGTMESDIMSTYAELKSEREKLMSDTIDKIVSGELKFTWSDTTESWDGYNVLGKKLNCPISDELDKYVVLRACLKNFGLEVPESRVLEYLQHPIEEYLQHPIEDNKKVGDMSLLDLVQNKIKIREKNNEKRAAIFAKAAKTNEKQEISHWIDECDDEDEDCSLDIVYEYAMPDGSVTVERSHSY